MEYNDQSYQQNSQKLFSVFMQLDASESELTNFCGAAIAELFYPHLSYFKNFYKISIFDSTNNYLLPWLEQADIQK